MPDDQPKAKNLPHDVEAMETAQYELDRETHELYFSNSRQAISQGAIVMLEFLLDRSPEPASHDEILASVREKLKSHLSIASVHKFKSRLNELFARSHAGQPDLIQRKRSGHYSLPLMYKRAFREKLRPHNVSLQTSRICFPASDSARTFAETFNGLQQRIVGDVIEVYAHYNLSSTLPLDQIGWSPSQITLALDEAPFDVTDISSDPQVIAEFEADEERRKRSGEQPTLEGYNGTKYTIVDVSSPFQDITDLLVRFRPTTYFDVIKNRPGLFSSPGIRLRFGHLDPRHSRIPQTSAVAFAALFADDYVLAIRRAPDTSPWPNTWSISGEEQIAQIDMVWGQTERMHNLLLRTAIEEIFPLARVPDPALIMSTMLSVSRYFRSMQTWSIFLEELTGVFQFFCVFQLDLTLDQYASVARELVRTGSGKRSYEGAYYAIRRSAIRDLVEGNVIPARPLFGGREVALSAVDLHPTSHYRLQCLLDYT